MPIKSDTSSKRKLLAVIEILNKYSDEEHPLNAGNIIERLNSEYGISAERKSLYRDIAVLRECGIDIERTESTKDGYYIAQRRFGVYEIRLLADAVLSSRFITPKKTKELIGKLSQELSVYQAEWINAMSDADNRIKFDNEQIFYAIDTVNNAIEHKKKILCTYHHRVIKRNKAVNDSGKIYLLSPYALLWQNEKYYVAANYEKYDNIANYRLDKMEGVAICDIPARPCGEVSEYKLCFDAVDYANKNFMMYNGKEDTLELICDNSMIDIIYDRFGNTVIYKRLNDNRFKIKAKAYISEGLADWLLPYCDRCYVNSPVSLRRRIAERARAISAFLSKNCESD